MAQIINLLEKAKLAKQLFMEKLEHLKANKRGTYSMYLCHLLTTKGKEYDDWYDIIEPFMSRQFYETEYNNIASHVSATVQDFNNDPEQIRFIVAEVVRIKWLDDLIAVAEQHGDDAQLPNIMSQDEIKELYASLKHAV